jgi:hypothetical protein
LQAILDPAEAVAVARKANDILAGETREALAASRALLAFPCKTPTRPRGSLGQGLHPADDRARHRSDHLCGGGIRQWRRLPQFCLRAGKRYDADATILPQAVAA